VLHCVYNWKSQIGGSFTEKVKRDALLTASGRFCIGFQPVPRDHSAFAL
jgi:hypothetical protein